MAEDCRTGGGQDHLKRSAFFVSDRTGITAEMLGHSLLTQFESIAFNEVTLPFIDTVEKARAAVERINRQGAEDGARPLVVSTLVHAELSAIVASANALFLDSFQIFIRPLEEELGVPASHAVGRSHSASDFADYHHRPKSVKAFSFCTSIPFCHEVFFMLKVLFLVDRSVWIEPSNKWCDPTISCTLG